MNQPMTRGCSSAEARTAIRSTKWPSRCRAGTNPGVSTPPVGSSWSAWAPPWQRAPLASTTGTRAEALVVDDGEVIGVQVRTDEGTRAIRARGGVVLAAGGFISNEAMVAEQCPSAHVPDSAWRIGTPNDDGRGIRMGVGAGAATIRLSAFECALPLGPPHRLARGILVNRQGERFINEDAYTGRIGLHALRDQDGFVYMITDDVIHERNLLGLRVGFAAATPEELAVDLEVPPDALARTVRDYNEAAARGEDPQFHKRAPFLQPIGVPPASGIGAIDLRVDHGAIYATFTLGGLVTDCRRGCARQRRSGYFWSLCGREDGGQPGGQSLCQWDKSRRRLVLRPPRRPSCRHPGWQRRVRLIDAKLALVDEGRIAQSEVMT